jgi:Tfp pilus assembly protein PilF
LVRKAILILLFFLLAWSCATYQPPPPSLFIGNLPQAVVAELSLDERILTEEVWENLRQGRGDKAQKLISKLGTESPFYYAGMGYASLLLNRISDSENYFKHALQNYPDMTMAHIGLAQVYQKAGKDDLAFIEFREILKREENNTWAQQSYEILKERKTQESLDEAKTYLAHQDMEKSKEAFLKALYYSPQSTAAHLSLAEILKKENNLKNALVHLKAASTIEPDNKSILNVYAETLYQAEDYPRSLEVYERLLDLEPENDNIQTRVKALKNRLGIFELPSQYDAIPASEAITKEEVAALIEVKFKDTLDEPKTQPPIIIDISTSWASKYILRAASLGLLDVYANHTFQPKKIFTRAEMADVLNKLINYLKRKNYVFISQIPPEKIQISDVSPDNYYYQPILRIISYGIMNLSADRTFNPDLPVSGQEAIHLLDIILTLIK